MRNLLSGLGLSALVAASGCLAVFIDKPDDKTWQGGTARVPAGGELEVYYPVPFAAPPNLQIDGDDPDGCVVVEQRPDHFRLRNPAERARQAKWEGAACPARRPPRRPKSCPPRRRRCRPPSRAAIDSAWHRSPAVRRAGASRALRPTARRRRTATIRGDSGTVRVDSFARNALRYEFRPRFVDDRENARLGKSRRLRHMPYPPRFGLRRRCAGRGWIVARSTMSRPSAAI